MKELILLGAGASAEAGVPVSKAMTEEILSDIGKQRRYQKEEMIIKFVIGGLKFQKGIKGLDTSSEVNIEELINTIQQLSDRQTSELSPFIASWHPFVNELDVGEISGYEFQKLIEYIYQPLISTLPKTKSKDISIYGYDFRKDLENKIRTYGYSRDMQHTFQNIVQQIVGDKRSERFLKTNRLITRRLIQKAWVLDSSLVGYLADLILFAKNNKTPIVTLNYDSAIELAAKQLGIEIDTGIEKWSEIGEFIFDANKLNYLKLHGSIDWAQLQVQ
jgi:hypothetical protein